MQAEKCLKILQKVLLEPPLFYDPLFRIQAVNLCGFRIKPVDPCGFRIQAVDLCGFRVFRRSICVGFVFGRSICVIWRTICRDFVILACVQLSVSSALVHRRLHTVH